MPAKLTLAAMAFLTISCGNAQPSPPQPEAQPQPQAKAARAGDAARQLAAIERASGGRLGVALSPRVVILGPPLRHP